MLGKELTTMDLLLILFLTTGWETCFGYEISQCGSDGKVDLEETGSAYLTCTGITDDTVIWDFERDDGTNLSIANCTWPSSVCTTTFAGYEVNRTDNSNCTLTVTRNHRHTIAGTVICGGNQNSDSARCKVRVVYKADTLSNCSVSVNDTVTDRDWTVTASCDVEKMYASDGHYSCRWVVPDENGTNTEVKGSFSTQGFSENRMVYKRGTCLISNLRMPTATRTYVYDVIVNPGNTRLTGPRLKIKQPGKPILSSCPDLVTEGDDVHCICQASDSSPPAVTTWFSGINSNNLLQLRNVSISPEDFHYTCSQYWGGLHNNFQKKINYRPRVTSDNDDDDSNGDISDDGPSIPTIVGGVGGVLVVIIVIVIIVVVVVKRRGGSPKVAKPRDSMEEGPRNEATNTGSGTEDDFEEHINTLYESSDAYVAARTSRLRTNQAASHPRDTNAMKPANEEAETDYGYTSISPSTRQPTADFEEHINDLYES
ncbi:uncharacterized protein [Littorina saxatilis]|uniref:uncharacterized protein isoform X2 n=1 Tax=Littorina saxatilis TaxID=31220 RepID=UPI0038B5D2A1